MRNHTSQISCFSTFNHRPFIILQFQLHCDGTVDLLSTAFHNPQLNNQINFVLFQMRVQLLPQRYLTNILLTAFLILTLSSFCLAQGESYFSPPSSSSPSSQSALHKVSHTPHRLPHPQPLLILPCTR